jgi:hypothetical protein
MGAGIPRLRPAFAQRVVELFAALAGDAGGTLYGAADAVELARQVIPRRFELPAELPPALRVKQIACGASNDRAHDRCDNCFVLHDDASFSYRLQPDTCIGRW